MRSASDAFSSFEGLRAISAYGDRRLVGAPIANRKFGVPPGGPFDRSAAALANALVGHPPERPTLEITLGPVVFEASAPLTVAVVGGPDGAFPLGRGERIEVRPIAARAYVAVGETGPRRLLADPPRPDVAPLRVVRGPQAGHFDFDRFLAGRYTVDLASNRVGVRLLGTASPHPLSLPSEPAIPGVVQIPPSGTPIVLGPDGPTIGGYPKVAVVIDADLDRLGRLRPGDPVAFQAVGLEEALALDREAKARLRLRVQELRVLRTNA